MQQGDPKTATAVGLDGAGASDELSSIDLKKCPVYKCPCRFADDAQLDAHYKEAHKDLIALGVSMGQDEETGQLKGCIKDTLLT